MRRDPIRETLAEARRRASLADRAPADQSPPGNETETESGAAVRIDPATWQPQYFGLFDATPLNEGNHQPGGFALS